MSRPEDLRDVALPLSVPFSTGVVQLHALEEGQEAHRDTGPGGGGALEVQRGAGAGGGRRQPGVRADPPLAAGHPHRRGPAPEVGPAR